MGKIITEKFDDGFEIKFCDEKFLTDNAEEFAALCRAAFAEHAARGVNMGPNTMTAEKFRDWANGCIGARMLFEGKMVAFWTARLDERKKIVHGRILAVAPEMKGKHIGTRLSLSRARALREMGMHVFIKDTSLKAPHVVAFHKSYGCKAVGVTSWQNTNYYSVILRMALSPEYEISDEEAARRYRRSEIWCKLRLREDGSKTVFGKAIAGTLLLLRLPFRIARKILQKKSAD